MRQMQDNLNKASQRGDRLDALQDKTDNLATSAQGFRRGANRVRKQMWWKDMKMRICIIVGIIILLVIIIVPSGKRKPCRWRRRLHTANLAALSYSNCIEELERNRASRDTWTNPRKIFARGRTCLWQRSCAARSVWNRDLTERAVHIPTPERKTPSTLDFFCEAAEHLPLTIMGVRKRGSE